MSKYVADEKSIRKAMIDKDIKSIAELSRLSGVSKPKIHEYLGGDTPLATTFVRLCRYLEIDPNKSVVKQKEETS
ncbi:MAG: helix-turn-helix transcriptional regulator [Defluviitaleaceae bacterium]|nr:helix-turn-helix transcriptional regulator [Defluviitaleaceae bacterium]